MAIFFSSLRRNTDPWVNNLCNLIYWRIFNFKSEKSVIFYLASFAFVKADFRVNLILKVNKKNSVRQNGQRYYSLRIFVPLIDIGIELIKGGWLCVKSVLGLYNLL